MSIDRAIEDANNGHIEAIVTAPIHKKAMSLADFGERGHTEYITKNTNAKESLMVMVADQLRAATLTNHLSLKEVPAAITKEALINKLELFNKSLKKDFGIDKPLIAVLGLNPHAGDEGLIGDEEENIIRPTIIEAKKNANILVSGPYPADGFFSSGKYAKVDACLGDVSRPRCLSLLNY